MFGFFKSLFGHKSENKVVEKAFEVAVLDDLVSETLAADVDPVSNNDNRSKETFRTNIEAIHKICCKLEKCANVQEALGVEGLLPSFYTCLLYDIIVRAHCAKNEKFDAFNKLIELCPASLGMAGQEVFQHVEKNDDAGQLIMAMKNFPLVVLDLATKTNRQSDGRDFLNMLAEVFVSAGEICEQNNPGCGFLDGARYAGSEWMDNLNNLILQ